MTKEEFLDYVNSFNKEAGEYTDDEVYAIGCKHKELPLGERNWNELAGLLGSVGKGGKPRNGEALRTFIKGKQYEDGTIVHNECMLSGQTIDGLTFPEFEEKTEELKRSLYIQQTKTRDEKNDYRRTLRDEARIETIKDLIKDSIATLPELPMVDDVEYKADPNCEAVLLLSDLHIGAYIDNFYNKYNVEIAKMRVNKIVSDTIAYCAKHGVELLNVINLGDLVQGIIHITARLSEEIDVIEQVMIASEILADALNKLQAAVPQLVYRSCLDNHSRCTANLKEHIEKENFGKLIDFYIEARLKDTNIIFAHDNLDDNIGLIDLMNGKKLIFVHGHQDNVNSLIQSYTAAIKGYVDYVCLGHYHSSKMKTFQNSKVFINGSIVGTEEYAMSRRLFGTPEQTLLVFDNNNLINITIDLDIK